MPLLQTVFRHLYFFDTSMIREIGNQTTKRSKANMNLKSALIGLLFIEPRFLSIVDIGSIVYLPCNLARSCFSIAQYVCMTTDQNVTAPKHNHPSRRIAHSLTTSQNVTAPKPLEQIPPCEEDRHSDFPVKTYSTKSRSIIYFCSQSSYS